MFALWSALSGGKVRKSVGVTVCALAVLLSGCLVNQGELWASDKLPITSPTTRSPSVRDISYGPNALHQLDLYLPATPVRGVIVWFHAGGWCCGEKADIDPLILSTIDDGYAVVSANYRLVPQATAEEQLADVDRVIRFVKLYRGFWWSGTGKLIVAGGSAGGTLALLAAAAPQVFRGPDLGFLAGIDPHVDAVISLVGPSDLRSYIDGTIGGLGPPLGEGFLGCSNRGSQWPTTTTSTTSTTLTTLGLTSMSGVASPETRHASFVPTASSSTIDFESRNALVAVEPAIGRENVFVPATPMPPCDPARVLKFSPLFWAALTVFLGGSQLPPAYLAYGDQDWLVPPSSQGIVLHDWWAAGGNWFTTYYDNPPNGSHNLSFDINATAFSLWLAAFASD